MAVGGAVLSVAVTEQTEALPRPCTASACGARALQADAT